MENLKRKHSIEICRITYNDNTTLFKLNNFHKKLFLICAIC